MNLFTATTTSDRWKNRAVASIVKNFSINDEDSVRSLLSEIVKGDRSISINSWAEINNEHIIEFERRIKEINLNSARELSVSDMNQDLENLKVSGEEGGRLSGESESSMGSNAAVTALRAREILLNYTTDVDIISYEHNNNTLYKLSPNIALSFNKNQRSKTYLPGNSQGDHISSYISIIMAFINTIRNESGIDQAIDEIRNVGLLLLSDDLYAVQQINNKQLYLSLSPDARNEALNYIPNVATTRVQNKSGDTIELPLNLMVKKGLIYEKINQKASLLSELSHYILTEIQKSKDFTVYSRGRIDPRKDEGATAKSSIRGLMALDKLCFISNVSKDGLFQEEISYLLKSLSSDDRKAATVNTNEMDEDGQDAHLMRYGLTAWFEDDGAQADSLKDELESAQYDSQRRDILNSWINNMMEKNREEKTISAFIGGLFDYDRKLVFNCEVAFPVTKADLKSVDDSLKAKTSDQTRIRKIKDVIIANVIDQFVDEFPKRNIKIDVSYDNLKKKVSGEISLTRNDTDKLAKIVLKHLGILDLVCANIIEYPTVNLEYQRSKKDFIDRSVLKNSGWGEVIGIHELNQKIADQITNENTIQR